MRQVSAAARILLAALAACLGGCGYQLAHPPIDPAGPFALEGGRVLVASAVVVSAAEAGARAELARAGQLAQCNPTRGPAAPGSPCAALVLDVLRLDEQSAAIAVAGPQGARYPLARALRITVTGRAYLRRSRAAPAERDTGDMNATEMVARADDPAAFALAREDAARLAARRLGESLVRRFLGFPESPP